MNPVKNPLENITKFLRYNEAPFRFSKDIRFAKQYLINKIPTQFHIKNFMYAFECPGLYAIQTDKGTKIGISKNLCKRVNSYLKPWVKVEQVFLLTFVQIPYSRLQQIEKKVKQFYSNSTEYYSSEFFADKTAFEVGNRIKFMFFTTTPKSNLLSDTKVTFKTRYFKPHQYRTKSDEAKKIRDNFY